MFTGLIAGIGTIVRRESGKLLIQPEEREKLAGTFGESIAINGCCLTLERTDGGCWQFHTMNESLRRTNLALLSVGARVNWERALRFGDALGGHLVQGHVDSAARIISTGREPDGDWRVEMELSPADAPLVVPKGSIAVDGISLTVAEVLETSFSVKIIPVTWHGTALRFRRAGDAVNLEFDVIGRYVRRFLECREADSRRESGLTMTKLREAGFL